MSDFDDLTWCRQQLQQRKQSTDAAINQEIKTEISKQTGVQGDFYLSYKIPPHLIAYWQAHGLEIKWQRSYIEASGGIGDGGLEEWHSFKFVAR